MKRMKWFWMAVLALVAAPAFAQTTGNVNIFLGSKTLDQNDWGPFYDQNDQGEFGVLIDVRGDYWPVSLAIDLLGSANVVTDYWGDNIASTSELDIGARKVFDLQYSNFHPYVGGGLAFVGARYEDSYYAPEEDNSTGLWLNGGFFVTLGYNFNIGLDLRATMADDVYIYGRNRDPGGTHAGLLLGYHW